MQCVSVLGLRRAGKTSFLQHVAHPEVMAGFLSDADRYAMIYVDVSACRTPGDFYGRVARRLTDDFRPAPPPKTRRLRPTSTPSRRCFTIRPTGGSCRRWTSSTSCAPLSLAATS